MDNRGPDNRGSTVLRHGYTGDYKEKGTNRSDFDGNTISLVL